MGAGVYGGQKRWLEPLELGIADVSCPTCVLRSIQALVSVFNQAV